MAISHIASIRGSTRMTAQQQKAAAKSTTRDDLLEASIENNSQSNEQMDGSGQSIEQHSASFSLMNITDNDSSSRIGESSALPNYQPDKSQLSGRASPTLEVLTCVADIDSHYEGDLHQVITIKKLEKRWHEITKNFDDVVRHLFESSDQITKASADCLQSLVENVETTCDKVDIELKTMYDLMTKCDELTTKLSIATTFRDEIKTLRKSVDTLEQLYKARSQNGQQKKTQ